MVPCSWPEAGCTAQGIRSSRSSSGRGMLEASAPRKATENNRADPREKKRIESRMMEKSGRLEAFQTNQWETCGASRETSRRTISCLKRKRMHSRGGGREGQTRIPSP